MRRHTLSRGKQWICPGLTQFAPELESSPPIFIHTPYEARHRQMIGKAWPANLFKLRWNWQQKRATCFVRVTIHESNLSCNKSGFCRLHNAVELLTIFCNNFSQPATIWFVARQVWPMGGINRCCCRSRTQQSGDRTFARHLNNGTQYPKFGPVSTYMLFKN